VIFSVCLVAAIWDLASRRIPNFLTFPLITTGLLWSAWVRGPWGFLDALVAATVLALPYVLLFVYGGGGGGDVKLMAGIGAWMGLSMGAIVLMLVALSGVLLGVFMALVRRNFNATLRRIAGIGYQLIPATQGQVVTGLRNGLSLETSPSQTIPYGVAIFMGICLAIGGVLLWRA
jgi:prepilin peptidase CpaA